MFCENCGKEVLNGNSFCQNCGASVPVNNVYSGEVSSNNISNNTSNVNTNMNNSGQSMQPKTNALAIVGFVLSIVGLCCLGIILGPIAIILGAVAKNQIKASNGTQGGDGLALAAIIIGIVNVVIYIALFALGVFGSIMSGISF